jgi:hypothetical protein
VVRIRIITAEAQRTRIKSLEKRLFLAKHVLSLVEGAPRRQVLGRSDISLLRCAEGAERTFIKRFSGLSELSVSAVKK